MPITRLNVTAYVTKQHADNTSVQFLSSDCPLVLTFRLAKPFYLTKIYKCLPKDTNVLQLLRAKMLQLQNPEKQGRCGSERPKNNTICKGIPPHLHLVMPKLIFYSFTADKFYLVNRPVKFQKQGWSVKELAHLHKTVLKVLEEIQINWTVENIETNKQEFLNHIYYCVNEHSFVKLFNMTLGTLITKMTNLEKNGVEDFLAIKEAQLNKVCY